MTEDADLSSKVKGLVAKAKNALTGADDGGATDGDESAGPVAKVKAGLSKAAGAVTGLIKKDDAGGNGAADAHEDPTENALKMKAAVEAARKARPEG